MKKACLTIVAACLVFSAGTVTGRLAQHSYDKPAMTSAADLKKLRTIDGCNISRTDGFLNYVCSERKKTGVQK
jgi:hypothetical protein